MTITVEQHQRVFDLLELLSAGIQPIMLRKTAQKRFTVKSSSGEIHCEEQRAGTPL
jgi:hypothetical protein